MGLACSKHPSSQDDALLAAIRDGEDETSLVTLKLTAQPSKYYLWAGSNAVLHVASNEGHLGVVKALVETVKPKPETSPKEKQAFTNFLNRSNSYGQTALMMACKTGHVEVVKYLLSSGADALVADKVHSRTGLHYAAWNGWANCIDALLSEECKVRLYNGLIGGAHEALVTDVIGIARMVDIRSESGFTPLHFAVSASSISAVKALLEKGASLTTEVLQGSCYSTWPTRSTPLHIAAAKGSASIVRVLLQAQLNASLPNVADPRTLRDANGKRPYDIARMLQHCRLESLLNPETPLSQAVAVQPRASRMQGCTPLTVLAGKAVQVSLLGQLDFLAWQLRLRDGAEAAMPRSLKRQLMKSAKESRRRIAVQEERLAADASVAAAETAREGAESLVSSDSEAAEGAGRDAVEGVEVEAAGPADEPTQKPERAPGEDPAEEIEPTVEAAAAAEAGECKSSTADAGLGTENDTGLLVAATSCLDRGALSECGVCLDRQTQLLIGECRHECCYECAIALVKKTKLSKSSIRCPYCRAIIGSFQLKDKANQPVMVGGLSSLGKGSS